MASKKLWSYDELIIAMNLYCKLPFGQFHKRNPIIIEVAKKLGRTPSSLAMKLCNLASIDPVQNARGIIGPRGASIAFPNLLRYEFICVYLCLSVVNYFKLYLTFGRTAIK